MTDSTDEATLLRLHLCQQRDDTLAECGRLKKQLESANKKHEELEDKCAKWIIIAGRWKRASKIYYHRVVADYDAVVSRAAGLAMRDGDLDALEKALGVKEEP